jgi:hypothetical protein
MRQSRKASPPRIERRLAGWRYELASAQRSLDRYFAAFKQGSLSPADCQERIAKLKTRI